MKSGFQSFLLMFALFAAVALASPMPAPSQSPPTPPTPPPATCAAAALCCSSTGHASDGIVGLIMDLLGIVVSDPNVLAGVTCSPLTSTCTLQPLCCTDNSYNGLIAIGCTPIVVTAVSP